MAGGPFERLEVSCFGDSYRRVLLDCAATADERLYLVGRLDVLRRTTWTTQGDSWASHGARNGSSLSRICRSRWGYLQPLRAQAIHTGWTVNVSLTDDTTSIGDFLRGCHGVNSRLLPGVVGFVENTLKTSLSKSMWDTRVTTGACRERDCGQFFYGCCNGSTPHD